MDPFKNIFRNAIAALQKLSFNQKIALGTLLIGGIILTTLFFQHGQNDYDILFSGLDEADAKAIAFSLRKQSVPFQVTDNGTTIMVPSNRKEELRLSAFNNDLVKGENTLGFDALSSLPFGLTSWQEQKYDQKIISDEVVKTLERIEGIKKARVILAQPKQGALDAATGQASASVMIIVEPGFQIQASQIRTIKALVAHSVSGLKPENVTVADSSGNMLADDNTSPTGNGGTQMDQMRSSYEKQKSKDLTELLTPLVGPNNVVVKVSATMNFDQIESKSKRLIPSGGSADSPTGIPVSVQSNVEEYAGSKGKGGENTNPPGVSANVPTAALSGTGEGSGGKQGLYQNKQSTTNYEVSTEEKHTIEAPGKIEKLSIAVVVNKVLTEAETKELKELITSAGGLDTQRGDSISISGIAYSIVNI